VHQPQQCYSAGNTINHKHNQPDAHDSFLSASRLRSCSRTQSLHRSLRPLLPLMTSTLSCRTHFSHSHRTETVMTACLVAALIDYSYLGQQTYSQHSWDRNTWNARVPNSAKYARPAHRYSRMSVLSSRPPHRCRIHSATLHRPIPIINSGC
jgi:hypothetical protein